MTFKPCYTWPNPAIPFRLYFNDPKCRIFIIENLQHNFLWLLQWKDRFRISDIFFAIIGCHYQPFLVDEASRMFDALSLPRDQFYLLYNDEREESLFSASGFNGEVINQNAWLDESSAMKPLNVAKSYDAVYVARLMELKRHCLSSEIGNLAIVCGDLHGATESLYVPPYAYRNQKVLSPHEVCGIINQSRCGLILSEAEGACFVSSEYLLCGIPVVSTKSEGGRDVWYDDYNSLVVEPTPSAVKEAVQYFCENPRDPDKIRSSHIEKARFYRSKFVALLGRILSNRGISYVDPELYFSNRFFDKMRRCYEPPFELLFGDNTYDLKMF